MGMSGERAGENILGCFPLCCCLVTKVYLTLETPWTVAFQGPLTMGFSRQEYWSGLPLPSPGGLPNQGIEPRSPTLQADSLPSEPPGKPYLPYDLTIPLETYPREMKT